MVAPRNNGNVRRADRDDDPGDRLGVLVARLTPAWHADAACRQQPDVDMFPTSKAGVAAALAVCGHCSAMQECRSWAMDLDNPLSEGVAGGMTAAARRVAGVRRKPGRKAS